MNIADENVVKLIEEIFRKFLLQTQSNTPQFSRDYFERFTQLLNQTFVRYPHCQPTIEQTISSISSPYHSSNLLTLEYQFRLIRYAFRQHLAISTFQKRDFLNELFHHSLLRNSSILRHLALQIAIAIYEQELQQTFDEQDLMDLIRLFSSDPNLYVRKSLVEFLALYLSKHDQFRFIEQIRRLSADADLIYQIFILLNPNEHELLLQQFHLYDRLTDTPAQRAFVLKTAKYLIDESPLIFYLNRIFEKSLSDYVHMLLTILSSRQTSHRSNEQLKICLKAVFLYIQDTEIEEIDETESFAADQTEPFSELTEYICTRLYERNIEPRDLASIMLDAIQPLIIHPECFLYQLDFYAPTIMKMLIGQNREEKTFAQLITCLDRLRGSIEENFDEVIVEQVMKKKRSTVVYRAFFDYILHSTNRTSIAEKIQPIVELLLFEKLDPLFQWDNQDCVLHFLKQLSQICLAKWLTTEFLHRIVEQFVHNTNEYIQGSLIDLLASLVAEHHLSPFDHYLTSNFIQLTDYSLGDVVRCALAHAWLIILTQSNSPRPSHHSYQFSFGTNIDRQSLTTIISEQIPLLIGDGGQQTEVQCLQLIETLETRTKELEKVLEFLYNDGCSNEIKEHAGRLLGRTTNEKKMNEILEDEFRSILHWLEHPDEHMILDCD